MATQPATPPLTAIIFPLLQHGPPCWITIYHTRSLLRVTNLGHIIWLFRLIIASHSISRNNAMTKKVAVSPEAIRNSVSYRSHSSLNSNHSLSNTQDPQNNGVSIKFPLLSEPYRPVKFPLLCPLAQTTVPTPRQVLNTTSP